jgi:hypothetical protein
MSDQLQTLQNRAGSNYGKQSTEILQELNWDNLETRKLKPATSCINVQNNEWKDTRLLD